MSLGSEASAFFGAAGAGAGGAGYEISRSLRFNSADSAYLNRTPASAGNRKTWTWAGWVKRSALGTYQYIWGNANSSAENGFMLRFENTDTIRIADWTNTAVWQKITTQVFRDVSAWYHIVVSYDTTNGTAADRVRFYVNGSRVTTFSTNTDPTQNYDGYTNNTSATSIGRWGAQDAYYFSGYLADIHFIDGQALDPTSFGEFDANGIWQPIDASGLTYGTNGFHLDFADNSTAAALGTDVSGNGNDWTVNNITVIAPAYSLPTNANTPVYEITIGATNPISGTYVWSNAFDGTTATTGLIGPITFIGTKPTWSTSTGVELMADGNGITASVNGGTQVALTSNAFVTISSGSSGTLNSIWIYSASGSSYIKSVRVDGVDISVKALLASASDIDSLIDVPTNGTEEDTGVGGEVRGNYCTWNPLDNGGALTLTNGNLDAENTTADHDGCRATIKLPSSGKWYFEGTVQSPFAGTTANMLGVATSAAANPGLGGTGTYYILVNASGAVQRYIAGSATSYTGFSTPAIGSILQVAYDADTGNIWFGLNNTWMDGSGGATGSPSAGTNPTTTGVSDVFPATSQYSTKISVNFGQRPFAYTAPSGFKALCTANLPAPTIEDGSTAMDVALWSGDGGSLTVSGYNLSPDFVWVKSRSSSGNHGLFDIVRGGDKQLISNSTSEELTQNAVTFTSDGFTSSSWNTNEVTWAGWMWDAGSSTVTNNDGSITSSVRANPSAGFSIVTYTGTGSALSFGHGLGVQPQFFIIKQRNAANYWAVGHSYDFTKILYLNTTDSAGSSATAWPTAPTSSVINLGTSGYVNVIGDFVAYCFAPVAGYSSFGSYTGAGTATGPFQYLGFRPRWIMIKRTDSSSTFGWWIWDTARNPYNASPNTLNANTSSSELTNSATVIDIFSNGFSPNGTGTSYVNLSGATYIYAAFAESPMALNNRAR